MVLENRSLFLGLGQAVSELSERLIRYGQRDFLMVVLTQAAMPIASYIAKLLKLNLTFSLIEEDIKRPFSIDSIEFDFCVVRESGRDLPQDFIFHQERNLKSGLKASYDGVYKEISLKYPDEVVVLVDGLLDNGSAFLPAYIQDLAVRSDEDGISSLDLNFDGALKVERRFVYVYSTHEHMKGIDMLLNSVLVS